MGRFVFKLPDVGEGTAEAELVGWHVKVGDVVEILVERASAAPAPAPAPTPTPNPNPTPTPAPPPPNPEAVEIVGIFAGLTGKPLDARIASWEQYLSSRPQSPYADAIRTDLDVLRGLRDQLRATSAPTTPRNSTRCWYCAGTLKYAKISANTNRLSTARLFSSR